MELEFEFSLGFFEWNESIKFFHIFLYISIINNINIGKERNFFNYLLFELLFKVTYT